MNESKKGSAKSPDGATLEPAPLSWSDLVKAGFPQVGEEIQIDLGRGRTLVLKYKGTDKNDNLSFKCVGTISLSASNTVGQGVK